MHGWRTKTRRKRTRRKQERGAKGEADMSVARECGRRLFLEARGARGRKEQTTDEAKKVKHSNTRIARMHLATCGLES